MEDDYDYDEEFLDPEYIEDYEDQTREEYFEEHEDDFMDDFMDEETIEDHVEDYVEDYIEENPINIAIARLDYLIAELEAGRIPNQKQPDKEKVKVTIVSQGRQSSNSNKTISSRAAYNKDDNRNAIVTLLIIAIIALLLIYALI